MDRGMWLWIVMAAVSLPALGAEDVTVAQLRQRVLALEVRVKALERWRKENTEAAPGEGKATGGDKTVLKEWMIHAKASSQGMLVKDRAARGGYAVEGRGVCAFCSPDQTLPAGQYRMIWHIKLARGQKRKGNAPPSISLAAFRQQGERWPHFPTRMLGAGVLTSRRYAPYEARFTLAEAAKVRLQVRQHNGAVVRVSHVELQRVEPEAQR